VVADVHTRLLVDDVDAVAAWYREHLGFGERVTVAGMYRELTYGDGVLGVYRRDLMTPIVGDALGATLIVVAVPDVDAFADGLSAGVEVVAAPTDRAEWVLRTIHLRDPAGNVVEVNHSLHER
jgi:lactoylglutathione lyase